MASEWRVARVKDLADSISETHRLGKEKLVFLNTSDVLLGKILQHSYSSVKAWPGQAKKSIQKDDILFSEIRPANGRYAYVDIDAEDYVVSTKLMVIRARRNRILPKFLYHFLTDRNITEWLQHLAESRSGTFPQITFDQVAELELSLPPMTDQVAIAAFLDEIDNKIDLNRRMNETLEAMARAIFKSWFVDFDPVRAKAEGRQPHGMDAETAALFPDSFQESPLGKIPKGWTIGRLDDLILLQRGFDLPTSKRTPGPYVVFSASGPTGSHTEYKVIGPGVVTGRSGLIGKVFLVHEEFWPLNTTLWVKEFRRSRPIHAFQVLQDIDFGVFNAGSAVPTLNRNHVHNLPTVVPPQPVVEAFENLGQPLYAGCHKNELQGRTLMAIRDTLLPKLISGEVQVKDAEKSIEALP